MGNQFQPGLAKRIRMRERLGRVPAWLHAPWARGSIPHVTKPLARLNPTSTHQLGSPHPQAALCGLVKWVTETHRYQTRLSPSRLREGELISSERWQSLASHSQQLSAVYWSPPALFRVDWRTRDNPTPPQACGGHLKPLAESFDNARRSHAKVRPGLLSENTTQ